MSNDEERFSMEDYEFSNELEFVPYDIYLSVVEERDSWEAMADMASELNKVNMEMFNKVIDEAMKMISMIRDAYPHITHKPTCDKPIGLECDCNLEDILTRYEMFLIDLEKRDQAVRKLIGNSDEFNV